MKTEKMIPATFLAVALTLTGIGMAGAQTADTNVVTEQAETSVDGQVTRADHRGDRDHGRDRGERRGGGMAFGALLNDANDDGAITQDEIDLFRTALVAGADASGEGDISIDEFQSIYLELMQERVAHSFERLDADDDGQITQAEMDEKFGDIVERLDRNDDGALTEDDRGHRKNGRDRS
ncbi:hypothetical protein MWU61_00595 [Loktanella sp. F6476L]|uniref:hypothetical protein n=1 Tax=Loktanella sp. F6476L TaxID=2926405 RepID=UPI001FF5B45D|nr:hypothetical protein [Loktanella sp. F6476L]MCK0119018.1 hypothetical protein [Loktanella sp. F6476L]